MANVLDLKRRIRSVKNTRQITKAMKMVSAAKLRRAQERAMAARPYAKMLASVLESVMRRVEVVDPETGDIRHPLLLTREEKRLLVVVVSGDKGFAGAFNANVLKAASKFLEEKNGAEIDIEAIGRKGRDIFRKRYPSAQFALQPIEDGVTGNPEETQGGIEQYQRQVRAQRAGAIEVTGDHPGMLTKLEFGEVDALGKEIVGRYMREEIDAVYLVFNEFQSVISQRLVVERILPIVEIGKQDIASATEMEREDREQQIKAAATSGVSVRSQDTSEADQEANKFGTAEVDYIYEQSPRELLGGLLPRYVVTELYHALLESVAAEHAARMTAMDAASNNAADMIDAYTLTMNRLRQAAITKEIIEIVSGAAAL